MTLAELHRTIGEVLEKYPLASGYTVEAIADEGHTQLPLGTLEVWHKHRLVWLVEGHAGDEL